MQQVFDKFIRNHHCLTMMSSASSADPFQGDCDFPNTSVMRRTFSESVNFVGCVNVSLLRTWKAVYSPLLFSNFSYRKTRNVADGVAFLAHFFT